MNNIIISVESTADLPKKLIEQYNINVLPLSYYVDGKEYGANGLEISNDEFYNKLKLLAKTSTSQANAFVCNEYLLNLLKQNKDIIHISFSGALSGTYLNIKKVAEELNVNSKNKIYVIDSLSASCGQGLLALLARENEDNFSNTSELVNYLENTKHQICHFFVVDNLKYLSKTGRISKVTATIGNVLQIKPILHVDNNGLLQSCGKVISRKKSIFNIAERLKQIKNDISNRILICHANCFSDAVFLQNQIERLTNIKPEIYNLGYVIGCHSGPGTLAVFFTGNER